MKKPRLLDLFCGAGIGADGYAECFDITGVDREPQPNYPYRFFQADALTFPLDGYDAYHASPLCQGYTELNTLSKEKYPRLIPVMRKLLQATGKPFVIENVEGAKQSMPGHLLLCGSMFGLRVQRHRLFESNLLLFAPGPCQHGNGCISVHGHSIWDSSQRGTIRKDGRRRPATVSFEEGLRAMGVTREVTRDELVQGIPASYTKWIGQFLMDAVESEAAG